MNENLKIIDTKSNTIVSSDNNVTIATGYTEDDMKKLYAEAKKMVDYNFANKRMYNAYTDSTTTTTLTSEDISRLSVSPQDNLSLAKEIGSYVRTFITKNDLIGKTYDSICNNINTDYTLSYVNYDDNRNKNKKLENAKAVITQANEDMNVKNLIKEAITTTYADGTYICYLDGNAKDGWCIDYFPLGIASITPYLKGGTPCVAIDMNELKQKVKPSSDYKDKNRKNKFFEDIDTLIKQTYPTEVYDAYKNGEKYAILNPERTGVMRINNLNRKYGVSPIFRAFEPLVKLETYDTNDAIISKAKAKKIIFQKLDTDYFKTGDVIETDAMDKAALAHSQLMAAWSNSTVLYTGLPWVADVKYVEPNATPTPIDTLNYNRNKIFTALGITFLRDTNTSATSGQLSVQELLKCINSISGQLETILEKFYKFILSENGLETIYSPKISIVDSEQLDSNLKKDISQYLFQVLGCSYDTAYHIFGINVKDEATKRQVENDNGYMDTFKPRTTGYTTNGDDNQTGRPLDENSKNPDKQLEDKAKNDNK